MTTADLSDVSKLASTPQIRLSSQSHPFFAILAGVLLFLGIPIAGLPGSAYAQGPPNYSGPPNSSQPLYDDFGYRIDGDQYGDSSDSAYGPRGRPNRSGGKPGSAYEALVSPFISLPNNVGRWSSLLGEGSAFEVETGPKLAKEADQAFRASFDVAARQLMYGHIAAEHEDAGELIRQTKFSTILKRPVWNIRLGISVAVRGDTVDDFQPIKPMKSTRRGSNAYSNSRNDRRDRDAGQDNLYSDPGNQGPPRNQGPPPGSQGYVGTGPNGFNTPDFDRAPSADLYGNGYQDPRTQQNGAPQAPVRSGATLNPPPMLSSDTDRRITERLGLVANVFASEFDKRFEAGDLGPFFTNVNTSPTTEKDSNSPPVQPSPVYGSPANRSDTRSPHQIKGELAELLTSVPEPLPMWRAGLTYVGEGPSEDTLETAKANQIDFLFHVDLILKKVGNSRNAGNGRNGQDSAVQNISRIRLYHVATGKSLASTKSLDSRESFQLVQSGRVGDSEDYVNSQMASFWRVIDRDIKTIPLPQISAQAAKKRVGKILAHPKARSLETLAEIRLYQTYGLLTNEEVENAFFIAGGPEALIMLHGSKGERLQIAREWALRSAGSEEDEG